MHYKSPINRTRETIHKIPDELSWIVQIQSNKIFADEQITSIEASILSFRLVEQNNDESGMAYSEYKEILSFFIPI